MVRFRISRVAAAAMAVVSLMLILGLGLSACGASGGAAETTVGGDTGSTGSTSATAGGKAAPSFSGSTLDGKTVSLDQFRGKPLLLVYMTYS